MVQLQFKRGFALSIPTLATAEPGVTTDTEKIYIGMPSGNTELAKQQDLDTLSEQISGEMAQQIAALQEDIALIQEDIGTLDTEGDSIVSRLSQAEADIAQLKDALFTNITGNPFTLVFSSLEGFSVTAGVYNAAQSRLEC